jgi:CPA2 family monovalent cation:H+ antiporter-2
VIVFAISDFAATRLAIRHVRRFNPSIFILVRTRHAAEVDELLTLGADQVIAEEFETSIEIFSRVLHQYHIPGNIIAGQISLVRFDGYKMLRGISLDQEKISRIAAMFAAATVDNIQVQEGNPGVGRSLRELDIRNASGASVIAIVRDGAAMTNPGPDVMLQADDIVVVLGSHEELDLATRLLTRSSSQVDAAG